MCVYEDLKEILNSDYKSNDICNYVLNATTDDVSDYLVNDFIEIKSRMIMTLRYKKIKKIFNG